MGSFCDSTSELNTSIMGMPVRIMLRGMMRLAGFTGGPPISIILSSSTGPLSRGRPDPVNTRPSSASEQEVRRRSPRKRTSALVGIPRVPANTCRVTRSPSRRMTCAREVPPSDVTSANSW